MNKKDTYRSAGVPTKRRFCGSSGDRAKAGAQGNAAATTSAQASFQADLQRVMCGRVSHHVDVIISRLGNFARPWLAVVRLLPNARWPVLSETVCVTRRAG